MSAPRLGFYDHHRQNYHEATWSTAQQGRDPIVGEFMIGDYYVRGGVGPKGELKVVLYDFSSTMPTGRRQPLSVQLQVFTDAYGTLRALDKLGVLDAVKRAEIWSRDDLTDLLLWKGLRDLSDKPVEREVAA